VCSLLSAIRSKGRSRSYEYYHCVKCNRVRTPKHELEKSFAQLLQGLEIAPEYLPLFREIVADVWRTQRENLANLRQGVEHQRRTLRTRLDRLDQAFLFEKAIDRESYERQRDLLRDELAIAELDLPAAQNSEGSLASVLGFTGYFVSNVSSLWLEATPELKRQLQAAVVPTGIDWDGATFGTALTAPIFNVLGRFSSDVESVVSPEGIEPSTNRLRVCCSAN
jgi:hypothetical protein